MKPCLNAPRHIRWPLFVAGLTAVVGLCISLHLRSRIAQTEANEARLAAETLRLRTEQEINLFVEVLDSVRALHALSSAVDQEAMDEFIEKGLVHQTTVLGAFGLTQRISPWMRAILEEQIKASPGTGYSFLQPGPDGTWVIAEAQPVYYPLTWQNQANALDIPIGFNFSAIPDARETIKKIELTRRTTLVPSPVPDLSINRASENNPQAFTSRPSPSYWVFSPVVPGRTETNPMYAPDTVIGFAVAKFHPQLILDRVASSSGPSIRLRLNLITPGAPDEKNTVLLKKRTWLYYHSMEVIGTRWIFECSMPATTTGRRSIAALIIGLVMTALLSSQLLILAGRTRKIEMEVLARTDELRIANSRLEKTFYERARLEEEIGELAARERRRIGRDLHDSLGQKLTGAVFLSRSLLEYFSQQGGERLAHAKTLNETLKSSVSQVRNMARGLAPVTLSGESLCEALKQLAEEMTGLYGVSCETTDCVELSGLDQKTKEQLYLIAREAVNNAARHAQAGCITIRLTGCLTGWNLRIEDNGRGFETQREIEGMGTRIMRHRADLINARFTITSAPGQGTCIEITSQIQKPF